MKKSVLIGALLIVVLAAFKVGKSILTVPGYVGTQQCATCHSSYANNLQTTLHSKIHLAPSATTMRPNWTGNVSMGASYGNASIALVTGGPTGYQVTLTPITGSPVTYDIAYTYGFGWKQRYLVKIENSNYILPIQYNINAYNDNSSGTWATYNPGNWFTSAGDLKPINNTFRTKSWDRNCSACHITGNKIAKTVVGNDTSWVSSWANGSSDLNMTVGCESCHGPGGDHVNTMSASDIYGPQKMATTSIARQNEMCGQCHSRSASPQHTYEYPYNEVADSSYYPGQVLANFYSPWQTLMNQVGGPGVWVDNTASIKHHQQWQDMSYSAHFSNATCFTCHDPHTNGVAAHQLKLANDNNDICLSCHSNFGSVGSPNAAAISAHTHHSYDPTNANGTGGASRCSKCHMAKTATTARAYDIHSHTWKVYKPIGTITNYGVTTPTLGMLNSCAISCHRNPTDANIPTFSIASDPTKTNWNEPTDLQLADTLNAWFNQQTWTNINVLNNVASLSSLGQNYPNPFMAKTDINFTLANSEFVTLKVYDLSGREIYTLVNQKMDKGTYNVSFDITNTENISSKVLFYKLTAGKFVATKKMVCVR